MVCAAAARIASSFERATAAESPLVAGVSDNDDDDDEDTDADEDDDAKFPSVDFGRRFEANGETAPKLDASACGDSADAGDVTASPCTEPADSGRWCDCAEDEDDDDGDSNMAEAGR